MYRLVTKRTGKKRVEENANASLFETQKTTVLHFQRTRF